MTNVSEEKVGGEAQHRAKEGGVSVSPSLPKKFFKFRLETVQLGVKISGGVWTHPHSQTPHGNVTETALQHTLETFLPYKNRI